jgi:hypothetical protein
VSGAALRPYLAPTCSDCFVMLTGDEAAYYGTRCEKCEGVMYARYEAWRKGRPDPDLDARFNDQPPLKGSVH